MMHECPMEWGILREALTNSNIKLSTDILRSLALQSENPAFRTQRFHDALLDYQRYGRRTPNKIGFDLDREIEFIKSRFYSKQVKEIETEFLLL